MTTGQLDLFGPTPEDKAPFYIVTCCAFCGDQLGAIEVEGGAAGRWHEPMLWGYLAQVEHNRARHPERVPAEAEPREL